MRIIHLSAQGYETPKKKPIVSKKAARQTSARRWMEVQGQADYKKALKHFDGEIKEIRDLYDKSFKPVKK